MEKYTNTQEHLARSFYMFYFVLMHTFFVLKPYFSEVSVYYNASKISQLTLITYIVWFIINVLLNEEHVTYTIHPPLLEVLNALHA